MKYIEHIRAMSDEDFAYFLNFLQPEIELFALAMERTLNTKDRSIWVSITSMAMPVLFISLYRKIMKRSCSASRTTLTRMHIVKGLLIRGVLFVDKNNYKV